MTCYSDYIMSVLAHEVAYLNSILHWDISTGNILIMKGSRDGGLLIDWDLCTVFDPCRVNDYKPRQYVRTVCKTSLISDPSCTHAYFSLTGHMAIYGGRSR